MTDSAWRVHLLLLGWAAVLVAAAATAWLYLREPGDRYYLAGPLRVDRRTGEVVDVEGNVLLHAGDAPAKHTPTLLHGVLDDESTPTSDLHE